MLSKIISASIDGIEAVPITIETDIGRGMPTFNIVGQADASVKEARERIHSAVINCGLLYPCSRITINLSPAGIRKKGSHLDLAMAVGILSASGQIFDGELQQCCFIGELSLDGSLQSCRGVLPMVMAAKKAGFSSVVVPQGNREEAMLVQDMQIYAPKNLREVTDHFNLIAPMDGSLGKAVPQQISPDWGVDYADVRGQEAAKRALTIAVAGGHGIFMLGSPSTGKTMLAERLPTIMPPMEQDEILETTVIYSIAGLLDKEQPSINKRPFRQPHPKITPAALLGGGTVARPGEITLANNGVLFLDEAGEFNRSLIDALRTPLEKKTITIARRGGTYTFPADFMLVAASNPCKCGYYQDPAHPCSCSRREILQYQSKLSGPILERIDLHLHLQPVDYSSLTAGSRTSSAQMRRQIEAARRLQQRRYQGTGLLLNHQLTGKLLEHFCPLDKETEALMAQAYDNLHLNPRTLTRVRRVARTIADLEGCEQVMCSHLTEALSYREKEI